MSLETELQATNALLERLCEAVEGVTKKGVTVNQAHLLPSWATKRENEQAYSRNVDKLVEAVLRNIVPRLDKLEGKPEQSVNFEVSFPENPAFQEAMRQRLPEIISDLAKKIEKEQALLRVKSALADEPDA